MKPTTIKRIMGFLMSALGVVMVFVALNAETFGFERGAGWGPARRFLLAVGISIILAPHSRHLLAAPLATLERTWDAGRRGPARRTTSICLPMGSGLGRRICLSSPIPICSRLRTPIPLKTGSRLLISGTSRSSKASTISIGGRRPR